MKPLITKKLKEISQIDNWGWRRIKKPQEIITEIDRISPNNEGGDIVIDNCKQHGNSIHIILKNEGGYNCTEACLTCLEETRKKINTPKINKYLKNKEKLDKINKIREQIPSNIRPEWEKNNNY